MIIQLESLFPADKSLVHKLTEDFKTGAPPSKIRFPTSKYVAVCYKNSSQYSRQITGIIEALAEKIFCEGIQDDESITQTFGFLPSSHDGNMKLHAFFQAARFNFLKAGSCSQRASYASFFLALNQSGVKVILKSFNPEKDQYVVQLNDRYIYDPLTHPECVFDESYYKTQILPTFSPPEIRLKPFSLTITRSIAQEFLARAEIIHAKFSSLIRESMLNYDNLKTDYNLLTQLINNGVLLEDYKNIIEAALKILFQKAELSTERRGTIAIGRSLESISPCQSSQAASTLGESSQPASSETEPNPEDVIAALKSLSKVQDIRLYKGDSVALLTLTGQSPKEATEITNSLRELGMMKVKLQKLKGQATFVVKCEEIDKEGLIRLAGIPSSSSPSTSFAGLHFRFD